MGLTWEFPYPSQRMPVFAENAVATSQPLAAQAGLQMLQRGGNAVDAALAAAIALTVVEPTSNGIGSDAFALVWDGETLHGFNGSGRSPKAWTPDRFKGLDGVPALGWDAITVPGAVDGWARVWERFGSLPFEDLFVPAVRYARDGYMVSPITAERWASARESYRAFPAFRATFLPGGRAPRPGERFRCPDMARTLETIAETRGEAFYRGELAAAIAHCSRNQGGVMTEEDLANHRSDWVEPIALDYQGITLHEIPPNGQGLAALIALGILRLRGVGDYPVDSADSIHLQIEAMKIAFAEAHRHIADPDVMEIRPRDLIDEGFLAERARDIRMDRAGLPVSKVPTRGGTVYLASADDQGRMVSFIQSNYMGFGSGVVIPDTGISMQNRGLGFVTKKNHPNAVDGGKRPYHTIIPGFVTETGRALMSFGVMGGHMQPQGHVQMAVRILDYRQNPQAACDAPRWMVDEAFRVGLEPGISDDVVESLRDRGHAILEHVPAYVFGGAQLIYRLEGGYCAASDSRKDGQAVGF